jgi:hypothetical protein
MRIRRARRRKRKAPRSAAFSNDDMSEDFGETEDVDDEEGDIGMKVLDTAAN